MRFYRLALFEVGDGSHGYEFFTAKADAEKRAREWLAENAGHEPRADVEAIEIEPTKPGILAAMNKYAGHNDNG